MATHPKYCLSVKGCEGVERRAGNRGKKLPALLADALKYMRGFWAEAAGLPKDTFVYPMGLDNGAIAFHLQQDPIHDADKTPCLGAGGTFGQASIGVAFYENHGQDSRITPLGDVCSTVAAKWGTGGNNTPLAVIESRYAKENAVVYGICANASNSMKSANPLSGFYEAQTARTLDQHGGDPTCQQGGMAIVIKCEAAAFMSGQGEKARGIAYSEKVSPTLKSAPSGTNMAPTAVIAIDRAAYNQGQNAQYSPGIDGESGKHYSVLAKGPGAVCCRCLVRKLTQTECERLQGFPDGWTKYGADGAEICDTKRYKAIGNSVALPVVGFVMAGIAKQHS